MERMTEKNEIVDCKIITDGCCYRNKNRNKKRKMESGKRIN